MRVVASESTKGFIAFCLLVTWYCLKFLAYMAVGAIVVGSIALLFGVMHSPHFLGITFLTAGTLLVIKAWAWYGAMMAWIGGYSYEANKAATRNALNALYQTVPRSGKAKA